MEMISVNVQAMIPKITLLPVRYLGASSVR